ncbi:hypothetical protein NC653_013141 [Populus alba x Populus x berolinensis]|uniref:Uncharacterized protein n=1 Tax=Populus alba x Populus x berolinensis TaxID=444605 RepID=A0AAD6QU44_9ROSI|nr:hypothetical protein NC653_013141 [Populus alba x Populus x berolinensis]
MRCGCLALTCSSHSSCKLQLSITQMVIPPPCPSAPLSIGHSSIFGKLTGEGPEINHGKCLRCAAAAKTGKLLGERQRLKDIPAVTVFLKRK